MHSSIKRVRGNWQQEEPGWWTSERYGGVCKETRGWCGYPAIANVVRGPFPTLWEAADDVIHYTEAEASHD